MSDGDRHPTTTRDTHEFIDTGQLRCYGEKPDHALSKVKKLVQLLNIGRVYIGRIVRPDGAGLSRNERALQMQPERAPLECVRPHHIRKERQIPAIDVEGTRDHRRQERRRAASEDAFASARRLKIRELGIGEIHAPEAIDL
jgi:hypothetical protein